MGSVLKVRCLMYELSEVRRVTGDAIRPGDFRLTNRALAFCSFSPGAKVLDVGCGSGATVEHLITNYNIDAVGVDPSSALLECGLQRRPGLPLLEAAGENLPFADGEMEGVLAECTLSVMENADRTLIEIYRVLKGGGLLVITDVYARNPEGTEDLRRLPLAGCLTGAMTFQELTKKISSSGFSIIFWEDHSKLLAELAARLILANGSMASFWEKTTCGTMDSRNIQKIIEKSRPGYFLLIARKPD